MNVNSIASGAWNTTRGVSSMPGGMRPPDPSKALAGVSEALGMSTNDLMSRIQSGSSLGQIADEKGVSRDDLLAAVKKGMENLPIPGGDKDAFAAKLIDQAGPAQGFSSSGTRSEFGPRISNDVLVRRFDGLGLDGYT